MFYGHNKIFWYQFCNFELFLKAENSKDSLASSCVEFSIGLSCNPVWVWDWVTVGTSLRPSLGLIFKRDTHSSKLKNCAVCRQLVSGKGIWLHVVNWSLKYGGVDMIMVHLFLMCLTFFKYLTTKPSTWSTLVSICSLIPLLWNEEKKSQVIRMYKLWESYGTKYKGMYWWSRQLRSRWLRSP